MNGPLNGRELGIARHRLRQLVLGDVDRPPTAAERVEMALAWFVNGDGLAYPSTKALHARVATENAGDGLHADTVRRHAPRLPRYITVGYLARGEITARQGAMRGVAVRAVTPALGAELGFPPLSDALERLEQRFWVIGGTDFVTTLWPQLRNPHEPSVHA